MFVSAWIASQAHHSHHPKLAPPAPASDFSKHPPQQAQAVKLIEKEIKDGKEESVKAFAVKSLPTIRGHLKAAQEINGRLQKTKDQPPR